MSVANANPYKDPEALGNDPKKPTSYGRLWPTVVIAALLFLITAQRTWMPLGLAVLLVPFQTIMLIFTVFFRRKHEHAVRLRFTRFGIYALMLAAAFGVATMEERLIKAQADELVAACEAYERDQGHLPTELSELVPGYRRSLPTALGHVLFLRGAIYYYMPPTEGGSAALIYRLNPDMSRSYSFETHEWDSR